MTTLSTNSEQLKVHGCNGEQARGKQIGGMRMMRGNVREAGCRVRQGKAEALMKGSLHTDELMGAVVARETGIRTARRRVVW